MQFTTGSYTGDGNDDRWINAPGFQPDLVIIKGNLAQEAVWRSSDMAGDQTLYFDNDPIIANRIQAFGANGFQIGTDAEVNTNGIAYYWAAFRDNGVGDFATGTYTGDGNDDRSIAVGFQPTVVWVKETGSDAGVWRIYENSGDDCCFFTNLANASNRIQAFEANGFQVGNDNDTNETDATYFWVAFKDSTGYIETGSYTGDGNDDRDITVGFVPDLVFVKGDAAQYGFMRIDTMAAGESANFAAAAPTTDRIQAFSDGVGVFQVGTHAIVNAIGTTYYWAAWRAGSTATTTSTSSTTSSTSTSLTTSTSISTSLTSTSVSLSSTSVSLSSTSVSLTSSSVSSSTSRTTSTSQSSSTSTSQTISTSLSSSTSVSTTTRLPLDDSGCGWSGPELDQILVPGAGDTYETHPLLTLFSIGRGTLRGYQGFGHAPLHFITQRGPYQDGETVLDMRYDVRTVQLLIQEAVIGRTDFWDRRGDLLDLLRPNRSFGCGVRPLVYRKWLPGNKVERGVDMSVVNGSNVVTSHDGRFVDRGGLDPGAAVIIAGVGYVIDVVLNDYTLQLTANYAGGTADGIAWEYRRGWAKRDLYCLLEQGPQFDEGPGGRPSYPDGYREALRFVAHDPMWYGLEQAEEWELTGALGDLVFDAEGAWLGTTAGVGRWLFAPTFVGQTVQVVYWGTAPARPTVVIDGPADYPRVANDTTGASIKMDYRVAAGETVTLDTLALTVTNQAGARLESYTTGDLATFSLEPHPQAPNRENSIFVSFSNAIVGQSAALLLWRNRYIGL